MSTDEPKQGPGFVLGESPAAKPGGLPRIDFATFVLSMAGSAMFHLGMAPDPTAAGGPTELNLSLARQTIDTIEMLAEKTRGNLDDDESKLLQTVLYELRMSIVRAERGS